MILSCFAEERVLLHRWRVPSIPEARKRIREELRGADPAPQVLPDKILFTGKGLFGHSYTFELEE